MVEMNAWTPDLVIVGIVVKWRVKLAELGLCCF